MHRSRGKTHIETDDLGGFVRAVITIICRSVEFCTNMTEANARQLGNQAGTRIILLANQKDLTYEDLITVIDIIAKPWHTQTNDIPTGLSTEEFGQPHQWKTASLIFIRSVRSFVESVA